MIGAPGVYAGLVAPAPTCRRSALHPGDFLMRRKSPKTHQGPPGPWTSGEGGLAPFDPPTLYPSGIVRNNLNPQASSMAPHLPRHGLKAESVTSGIARGEKKTGLPTCSKWQIGLLLWLKVARREPERSAASAKRAATTHRRIPKGTALGAPLVTFPASGKSPGCRAERLHKGGAQRRASALLATVRTARKAAQRSKTPSAPSCAGPSRG